MFVVMADQRGSRKAEDLVPSLLHDLNRTSQPWQPLLDFERTAGDEVQGLLDGAAGLAELLRHFGDSNDWSIGVGIGSVEAPLPSSTRAATGTAYLAARNAIESAKRAPGWLRIESSSEPEAAQTLQALTHGLFFVQRSRSQAGREAVALSRQGRNGKTIAKELGISPQAVSTRLRIAGWDEEQSLMTAITTTSQTCHRRAHLRTTLPRQ